MINDSSKLTFEDLDCMQWRFPASVQKDEHKYVFLNQIHPYGTFADGFSENLRTTCISDEQAIQYRKSAYEQMCSSLANRMKLQMDCHITRCWTAVRHYLNLIQSEFDIEHSRCQNKYSSGRPWPLPDENVVNIWNSSYAYWKSDIELYIKALYPVFTSPQFAVIIKQKTDARQKCLNDFLYNRRPPKRSDTSDGEAEFWNAANSGNLDAIGF